MYVKRKLNFNFLENTIRRFFKLYCFLELIGNYLNFLWLGIILLAGNKIKNSLHFSKTFLKIKELICILI